MRWPRGSTPPTRRPGRSSRCRRPGRPGRPGLGGRSLPRLPLHTTRPLAWNRQPRLHLQCDMRVSRIKKAQESHAPPEGLDHPVGKTSDRGSIKSETSLTAHTAPSLSWANSLEAAAAAPDVAWAFASGTAAGTSCRCEEARRRVFEEGLLLGASEASVEPSWPAAAPAASHDGHESTGTAVQKPMFHEILLLAGLQRHFPRAPVGKSRWRLSIPTATALAAASNYQHPGTKHPLVACFWHTGKPAQKLLTSEGNTGI